MAAQVFNVKSREIKRNEQPTIDGLVVGFEETEKGEWQVI